MGAEVEDLARGDSIERDEGVCHHSPSSLDLASHQFEVRS